MAGIEQYLKLNRTANSMLSRAILVRTSHKTAGIGWRLLAFFVFTAAFLTVTIKIIAPPFFYIGFVKREWFLWEIVLATCVSITLAMIIATRTNRSSSYAQAFLVSTVAIPVVWIPMLYGPLDSRQVLALQGITLLCFSIIAGITATESTGFRLLYIPAVPMGYILAGVSLVIFLGLVFGLGLTPSFLGLSEVYDHREDYNEAMPVAGRYMVGALVNAILPLVFAIGYAKKSFSLILISVLGFLLAYSITGFRSFLVGLGIIAAGALVFGVFKRGPAGWFLLFSTAMFSGWLADLWQGGIEWTSLVTRRAIATTGINTAYYVDYFSENNKYELRHSVLSWMADSPYQVSPPTLIGSNYYASEPNANANFLADGFANFGWFGMVGAAVVVGLLLKVYDRLTNHLPVAVSVLSFTMVLISLSNSGVLTVILTHGAAAAVLLTSCVAMTAVDTDKSKMTNGHPENRRVVR